MRSPPFRFLLMAIGGWTVLRCGVLASEWLSVPAPSPEAFVAAPRARQVPVARAYNPKAAHKPVIFGVSVPPPAPVRLSRRTMMLPQRFTATTGHRFQARSSLAILQHQDGISLGLTPLPGFPASLPALSPARESSRIAGSAWAFMRQGTGGGLVPEGSLGGSQVGARVTYRLNSDASRPLALSARLYAPLEQPSAAEGAIGFEWKPLGWLPVRLLAERRQALAKDGRSAFSLLAHGGISDVRTGPLRLDAYGQAGLVGLRSKDLFADGSARLSLPAGRLKIGAGIWGAAQPGIERIDVGPQASYRLTIKGTNAVIAADWRYRVAGDAAPRSGPTLTVATDF
jgi:hypothetical protein